MAIKKITKQLINNEGRVNPTTVTKKVNVLATCLDGVDRWFYLTFDSNPEIGITWFYQELKDGVEYRKPYKINRKKLKDWASIEFLEEVKKAAEQF